MGQKLIKFQAFVLDYPELTPKVCQTLNLDTLIPKLNPENQHTYILCWNY